MVAAVVRHSSTSNSPWRPGSLVLCVCVLVRHKLASRDQSVAWLPASFSAGEPWGKENQERKTDVVFLDRLISVSLFISLMMPNRDYRPRSLYTWGLGLSPGWALRRHTLCPTLRAVTENGGQNCQPMLVVITVFGRTLLRGFSRGV